MFLTKIRIRAWIAIAALFPLISFAVPGHAADGDSDLLATVNGEAITLTDLERELAFYKSRLGAGDDIPLPAPDAIMRRLVQNRLVEQEGYASEAESLDNVHGQVVQLIKSRSILTLLDSVAAPILNADPGELDSILSVETVMYRVSHILVDDEETAVAMKESLAAGHPFGGLADRHSIDTLATIEEGDLGWAREGTYIPEFEAALSALSIGEVSEPVSSEFGWHIIKLTDTRVETAGQSDEMKAAMIKALTQEKVKAAVESLIESLKEKYEVTVDDSLLASLDYGTSDPAVLAALKASEEVLADSPYWKLRVRSLTRRIQFKHFHGLEGKPEAPMIRDKMFDEYLNETLLAQEAKNLGVDKRSTIVEAADALERDLVREIALARIVEVSFEPGEDEVERFYEDNAEKFTPNSSIKVQSVVLRSEQEATHFRKKIDAGASLRWLSDRIPEVVAVDPTSLNGWLDPELLGITGENLKTGDVLGPLELTDGWTVLVIKAIQEPEPTPLSLCRQEVLKEMRVKLGHEVLSDAINRLEEASDIDIRRDAGDKIQAKIEEWKVEADAAVAAPTMGN